MKNNKNSKIWPPLKSKPWECFCVYIFVLSILCFKMRVKCSTTWFAVEGDFLTHGLGCLTTTITNAQHIIDDACVQVFHLTCLTIEALYVFYCNLKVTFNTSNIIPQRHKTKHIIWFIHFFVTRDSNSFKRSFKR